LRCGPSLVDRLARFFVHHQGEALVRQSSRVLDRPIGVCQGEAQPGV
jgi:hypothetical protein